jgi:hypothetical protein
MKRMTQAKLRTFAESLTEAIEEVASKIGTIESILNGSDEVDEDTPAVTEEVVENEDDTVSEPPVEEEEEVPATAEDETPVAEDTVPPAAPESGEGEAVAFSEKNEETRYQTVKEFLSKENL